MALWEYKVITSGPHGFASPALLEAHLNALGKDEWEIIHFQTLANNALAFHGLARRSTLRDWTPPPEVVVAAPSRPVNDSVVAKPAAAAKPELDSAPAQAEEKPGSTTEPVREETLRPMRNTEHDLDPDADDEEDDWDDWEQEEDELPTFFEALKPHLRRNQKGPGMSVAVDYLAKRWEQRENDLIGALKECGFTIPETEEADPEYFEFEGDLYWVNRNNRGQLFINTREKPRPVFRTAPAKKLANDDPAAAELVAERAAEKAEIEKRKQERQERAERHAAQQAARDAGPAVADQPDSPSSDSADSTPMPSEPLPTGPALLDKIRPLMRRNRRGPGYSGSVGFLARAFHASEADLIAGLAGVGLIAPASSNDKAVNVEIGGGIYWMNRDNRGGIWINGRENRGGGQRADGAEKSEGAASANADENANRSAQPASAPEAIDAAAADAATEAPGAEAVPAPVVSSNDSSSADANAPAGDTAAADNADEGKSDDAAASDESADTPKRSRTRGPRRSSSRPRTRKGKVDTDGGGTKDESAVANEAEKTDNAST